ncbi:MAG: TA system VapC family ribonuclease toxin [Dehalococcoidia bacterium]
MLLPDVNILVDAYLADTEVARIRREWLGERVGGQEPFGMSESVLSAFLRVATNARAFRAPPSEAQAFAAAILSAPNCVRLRPGPSNWTIFQSLCRQTGFRGAVLSDLYHAALAIEHDCEWVTGDADFGRIPGLRWRKLPE